MSPSPAWEAELVDRFNAARDAEYEEILDSVESFEDEIRRETLKKRFRFAELEEGEADWEKLQRWFARLASATSSARRVGRVPRRRSPAGVCSSTGSRGRSTEPRGWSRARPRIAPGADGAIPAIASRRRGHRRPGSRGMMKGVSRLYAR